MKRAASVLGLLAVSFSLGFGPAALRAQSPVSRIDHPVDNQRLVTLTGNTHPQARAEFDRGQVDDALPMNRIVLVLARSPEQEAALTKFMAEQYDPKSPNFHHWLSAQEFGTRFGVSDQDLATVQRWLVSQGFSIGHVASGRTTIEFSGNAGQVRKAFHTEIHRYLVAGVEHTANQSDPQIPEALAPVVKGIASLHNFFAVPQSKPGRTVKRDLKTGRITPVEPEGGAPAPLFTSTNGSTPVEDVTPYDLATIYNVLPLRTAGYTGTGQTIAIDGTSDIKLSDIATFQSSFGLPNNPPTIIHNGYDPGTDNSGGAQENTLDVEMSSAMAPQANIVLVISPSTNTTDAVLLSEMYIVDYQVASIMTLSYGECELYLGSAGNAAYNAIAQQGAAEGISIFVAAGDSGSPLCEDHNAYDNPATTGLQVNGIASNPYVTAVGGTDLAWQSSPSTYWNTTNATNGSSAKGYVPETTWNSTCTGPLVIAADGASSAEAACNNLNVPNNELVTTVGGSGGVSQCTTPSGSTPATCAGGYAKPAWQVAPGVPADGKRDLPDVSLFGSFGIPDVASSKYLLCFSYPYPCAYSSYSDYIYYQENGGTSASTPAMAGVMALVLQKTGSAQGLPNPVFYQLAATQNNAACNASTVADGNSCLFYDVTAGSNTTPCVTGTPNCVTSTPGDALGVLSGYNASAGYDLATGLGSINVTNLVNAWAALVGTPVVTVTVSPATLVSGQVSAAYTQQFTASGGTAPYSYAVSAGAIPPGLTLSATTGALSGTPTTANTYSFTVTATDSSAAGPYSGHVADSLIIHQSGAVPTITWNPSTLKVPNGSPIGAGVLDATASVPGSFVYAIPQFTLSQPVTASTVLEVGTYTIAATFTPTDTVDYTRATASITFTVYPEHIWVANSTGGISGIDPAGNVYSAASATGGLTVGIGVDGTITSAVLAGTSVSTFDSNGKLQLTRSGASGGLNAPTAEMIDGNENQWFTNSNNTVSAFTYDLSFSLSPPTGFAGGGMNNPQGIAVDNKGSVWIANAGNNSVTEIIGAATPAPPIVQTVVSPPQ